MKLAKLEDLKEIFQIFSIYKNDIFPHIRQDYLTRKITSKCVIFDGSVVIVFGIYSRKQHIGNVFSHKGDAYISQIVTDKTHSGIASIKLQEFFQFINRPVWLTVRTENIRACKFYEKNGMKLVGKISWKENTIEGSVYFRKDYYV